MKKLSKKISRKKRKQLRHKARLKETAATHKIRLIIQSHGLDAVMGKLLQWLDSPAASGVPLSASLPTSADPAPKPSRPKPTSEETLEAIAYWQSHAEQGRFRPLTCVKNETHGPLKGATNMFGEPALVCVVKDCGYIQYHIPDSVFRFYDTGYVELEGKPDHARTMMLQPDGSYKSPRKEDGP